MDEDEAEDSDVEDEPSDDSQIKAALDYLELEVLSRDCEQEVNQLAQAAAMLSVQDTMSM